MKKLLALFVGLVLTTNIIAQEIKIAPVLGMNLSFAGYSKEIRDIIKNDFPDALKDEGIKGKINLLPAVRVQVGGIVDYSFNESLSLQTGLLLNLRGYASKMKLKENDETAKYTEKARIAYLELPLWGKYQLGESGFSVSFGPTIGVALSGKTHAKATIGSETKSETASLSIGNEVGLDNLKRMDISLNLGIAQKISVADNPLEVSLNFQPSLTKWSVTGNPEYYGRYFTASIRVAYFFPLNN